MLSPWYNGSFDFINKPNFSGLCLFSSIEGNEIYCRRYVKGCISQADLISNTEQIAGEVEYLSLVNVVGTKDGDDEPILIPGSICIGYRTQMLTASWCFGSSGGSNGGSNSNNRGGNGWGAGNGPSQDIYIPKNNLLYPQQDDCCIEVVTNYPDTVTFSCNGRYYTKGSYVFVSPTVHVSAPNRIEFSKWVGDFSDKQSDSFSLFIEDDYKSMAYYNIALPCVDRATGKGNPLVKMSIASSAKWGNWYGGTYGDTRTKENGDPQSHSGIDLAAAPGTPVYSMLDGEITYIK